MYELKTKANRITLRFSEHANRFAQFINVKMAAVENENG